jgi:hypothetical protein
MTTSEAPRSMPTAMSKQSPIRYLAITTVEGKKFILRITRETPVLVSGIEVDKYGDEIVPTGFHNRTRIVDRDAIKRAVEMRMNVVYAQLERAK